MSEGHIEQPQFALAMQPEREAAGGYAVLSPCSTPLRYSLVSSDGSGVPESVAGGLPSLATGNEPAPLQSTDPQPEETHV